MAGILESGSGAVVSVSVESVADKVFNKLINYLENHQQPDYSDELDTIAHNQEEESQEDKKRAKAAENNNSAVQKALAGIGKDSKTQVKSLASEKSNRAVQNALLGNISKATKTISDANKPLVDAVKGIGSTLKGLILTNLTKSLNQFTELAKIARKNNLTAAQKDQIQAAAGSTISTASSKFGVELSGNQVNDALSDIIGTLGKSLDDLSSDQVAAFAALKSKGLDAQKAFDLATSASTETIHQMVKDLGDPAMSKPLKSMLESAEASGIAAQGGWDAAYKSIAGGARDLQNEVGNVLGVETTKKLAAAQYKVQNNLINQLSDDEKRLLLTFGNTAEETADKIKNMDPTSALVIGGEAGNALAQAGMAANAGTKMGTTTRSDAQNAEANRRNTENGKIPQMFDKFTRVLDGMTGGLIGKTANIMDELLGDGADMSTLVTGGFKLVAALLASIQASSGFLAKVFRLGIAGAGLVLAYELVKNFDKFEPLISEGMDMILEVIEKLPDALGKLLPKIGSFLQKLIPKLFSAIAELPSLLGGLFGGGGGLGESIGASLSSIDFSSMTGPIVDSIKGLLSGIGDLLMNLAPSLASIIGSIADAIVALAPAIEPIVRAIADVINNLITAVAPYIPEIVAGIQAVCEALINIIPPIVDSVKEVCNSIIDCVRDIGVAIVECIDHVLVAIAPAINSIGRAIEILAEAIAPTIPTIVDMLDFAVHQLLPPLLRLFDWVCKNILPPLLQIIKQAVEVILPPLVEMVKFAVETILPPVVEILKTLVDTLMPPLQEAITFIIEIIERICNLILDFLEPPLRAISELLASVVEVTNSIVGFVGDIVDTGRGLFNWLASLLPDAVGYISGTFNFLKDYILPIVKNGFNIVYNVINLLYTGIKAIIINAIWPIKKVVDAISYVVKSVYQFLLRAPVIGTSDWDTKLQADREAEVAQLTLMGHDASEQTEALQQEYKRLSSEYGEDSSQANAAYNKFIESLKNDKSSRERANDDAAAAFESAKGAIGEFTDSIKKAVNSDGIQFDTSAKDNLEQYLTGAKGSIAGSVSLPPNTGEMLNSISDNVATSTSTLKLILDFFKNLNMHANGTPSTKGAAIVGEDGREAILPLEKPNKMKKVFSEMASVDKKSILKAANSSNSTSSSSSTSSPSAPIQQTEFTKKVLEGARAQYGKKYSEMVCNQLVEAALKYAGFTPPTTGVVTKHFNHPKMKIVLNDPANGISPKDKSLVPGMIMFSHPFTQEEADQLNADKGGKRKAGDPGHMGIYAGDGLWWNSTSSKKTTDYSTGKAVKVTDDNKGFGVALTAPFTSGKYKLYAAGFYDGMFDPKLANSLPSTSPNKPMPSSAKSGGASSNSSDAKAVEATPVIATNYDQLISGLDVIDSIKDKMPPYHSLLDDSPDILSLLSTGKLSPSDYLPLVAKRDDPNLKGTTMYVDANEKQNSKENDSKSKPAELSELKGLALSGITTIRGAARGEDRYTIKKLTDPYLENSSKAKSEEASKLMLEVLISMAKDIRAMVMANKSRTIVSKPTAQNFNK